MPVSHQSTPARSARQPAKPRSVTRFIGLDIHKRYIVAAGVDRDRQPVLKATRIGIPNFAAWIDQHLGPRDAVAVEMTTNTYQVYDLLVSKVHSVTVVHPPHVALIVRAQVKTDRKAAQTLAEFLAVGLLVPIWVPPPEVRDLRAMVAQRHKMTRLVTQAKNRLHSVLHRHHIEYPEGDLFGADQRAWWLALPVTPLERVRLECDLATLAFAHEQIALLMPYLARAAAHDPRLPLLVQLPGIALLSAITILAAIGDITRFPSARQLVGYAGLGARVHISGDTHQGGRITKAGRRDLRHALVGAANNAGRTHPHWQGEMARLEKRIGRNKAKVAIARKLLVAIWHILTEEAVDRFAEPEQVACSLFAHAYKVGVKNLPDGLSAREYTRRELDRLGIGADLEEIPWGTKHVHLPPSTLTAAPAKGPTGRGRRRTGAR